MKLIYCNFKKAGVNEEYLEFNFSKKFNIKYNPVNKSISVENKNTTIPDDFFAENVDSVNLVVGENGVGKSTILDIIGLMKLDLIRKYRDDSWVLIYEMDEINKFGIELSKFAIKNIDKPYMNSVGVYSYNAEENFFVMDMEKTERKQMNIFYLFSEIGINKENFDSKNIVERHYLNQGSYADQVMYINESSQLIKNGGENSKITYQLKINEREPLFEEYIYADDYLKSINDLNVLGLNKKQAFILVLREQMIIKLLNDILLLQDNKKLPAKEIDKLKLLSQRLINLKSTMYEQAIEYQDYCIKSLFEDGDIICSFLNLFDNLEDELFIDYNKIRFDLPNNNIEKILDFLKEYDKYVINAKMQRLYGQLTSILQVGPIDISDGQIELINLNSSINTAIKNGAKQRNNLLVLDEPGIYLHPEWSRSIISFLIKLLKVKYPDRIFSIIIATHSPFLVSDIPGQFIHKISIEDNHRQVTKGVNGYGQNIYDLLKDTFFLKAAIGAFAQQKINGLVTDINNPYWLEDSVLDNQINQQIELIDDGLIKDELKRIKSSMYVEHLKINQALRRARIRHLEKKLKLMELADD